MDLIGMFIDDIPIVGQVKAVYDMANGSKTSNPNTPNQAPKNTPNDGNKAGQPQRRNYTATVASNVATGLIQDGLNSLTSSSPQGTIKSIHRLIKQPSIDAALELTQRPLAHASRPPAVSGDSFGESALKLFTTALGNLNNKCSHQCVKCQAKQDKECEHLCEECLKK